jgi:hypothetical protein
MSSEARCDPNALLVGTDVWLPEDPSECLAVKTEAIGCNRLFCSTCRSWVRHLDNVRFSDDGAPPVAELETLFKDPIANRYRGFRNGWLGFRVYLCRCSAVEIAGVKQVGWLDNADGWSCAGHPERARLDKSPHPSGTDSVEMNLRSSAAGPPSFGDMQPWDFALRWPQPFIFATVWPVMTMLLIDSDPIVRTRAVEFVNAWRAGDSTTLPRLLEIVKTFSSLYQEPGLRSLLAFTLSNKGVSIDSYRPTIAKAIVMLLDGAPPARGAETIVAEYEPEAVIRAAGKWTERSEDQSAVIGTVGTMVVFRRDKLLELLHVLAARSLPNREEILREVSQNIDYPDDDLRKILDGDGIPMPKTHPTLDECRRALGLDTP